MAEALAAALEARHRAARRARHVIALARIVAQRGVSHKSPCVDMEADGKATGAGVGRLVPMVEQFILTVDGVLRLPREVYRKVEAVPLSVLTQIPDTDDSVWAAKAGMGN